MKLMKFSGYLGAIGALVEESTADDFRKVANTMIYHR